MLAFWHSDFTYEKKKLIDVHVFLLKGMAGGEVWSGAVPRSRSGVSTGVVTGATTKMASTGRSATVLKIAAMVLTSLMSVHCMPYWCCAEASHCLGTVISSDWLTTSYALCKKKFSKTW